jgi:phage baseplate assembly protein W
MSFDLKINNGDFVLQNGDIQTVINQEKLEQDILKICLTPAGSNVYQPWYGSFLTRSIIGTAIDTSILVQVAKSQLTSCLNNLQNLQAQQVKSFQSVSADEQIAAISNISVVRNTIDPRFFTVKIRVKTKGLTPVSTGFNVSTL